MTPREEILARVLGERRAFGPVVVLSAKNESSLECEERLEIASVVAAGQPVIFAEGANTRDEADHVLDRVLADDLTIVTGAYHAPRALLTYLQVLRDRGRDRRVRLWMQPVPGHMEKLDDEWAKIDTYQTRGHVASYQDGVAYLRWRDLCG